MLFWGMWILSFKPSETLRKSCKVEIQHKASYVGILFACLFRLLFAYLFVVVYKLECVEPVSRKIRPKPMWSPKAASSMIKCVLHNMICPVKMTVPGLFTADPSFRLQFKGNFLRKSLPWWVSSRHKISCSPDSSLNFIFLLISITSLIIVKFSCLVLSFLL